MNNQQSNDLFSNILFREAVILTHIFIHIYVIIQNNNYSKIYNILDTLITNALKTISSSIGF